MARVCLHYLLKSTETVLRSELLMNDVMKGNIVMCLIKELNRIVFYIKVN